jgi:hypothetical protein
MPSSRTGIRIAGRFLSYQFAGVLHVIERRQRRRYNITLSLEYFVPFRTASPVRGGGVTENISSSGLLFRCADDTLHLGTHLMAELEWPTPPRNGGAIRLSMSGYVVRITSPKVAVAIGMHYFKHGTPEDSLDGAPGLGDRRGGLDPGTRPLVLVVEGEALYRFVAAMLSRYEYPVAHVSVGTAQTLLRAEQSQVGVLITDRIEEFEDFKGRVPIIYTGGERTLSLSRDVIVVGKPVKYRSFRSAVGRALQI